MINSHKWKIKLVYIEFGSLFGCLCTIIGMLTSPATAQRNKFDTIKCSRLEVVDAEDKVRAVLDVNEYGGGLTVFDKGGRMSALLNVDGYGGTLSAIGSNGNMRARLGTDEYGGSVDAYGEDGKSSVVLGVTEHGGYVQIEGKGEGKAAMGINEYGNGAVSTWDKNGYRQ